MNNGTTTRNYRDPLMLAGRDVNELFDRWFDLPNARSTASRWSPAATVWEDDDSFHVDVELPGVDRDAIEITFEKGRLLIAAKRPKPETEHRVHHDERAWGEVTRGFNLPDTVDAESVEASLHDGVLNVTLAKRPEVLPRKIEIKAN